MQIHHWEHSVNQNQSPLVTGENVSWCLVLLQLWVGGVTGDVTGTCHRCAPHVLQDRTGGCVHEWATVCMGPTTWVP